LQTMHHLSGALQRAIMLRLTKSTKQIPSLLCQTTQFIFLVIDLGHSTAQHNAACAEPHSWIA
jgi:hypothetical protein